MKQTIVLFSFEFASIHLAAELDLVRVHIEHGHRVIVVICNRCVNHCTINMYRNDSICSQCTSTRILLFQKYGAKVLSLRDFSDSPHKWESVLPVDKLISYEYKGHPFGRMTLSSYSFYHRRLEVKYEDQEMFSSLVSATVDVYEASCNAIRELLPDVVYVFNVRFVPTYGVVTACQDLDVRIVSHERGANINQYELYENAKVHDPVYVSLKIKDACRLLDAESIATNARRFYHSRRYSVPLDGFCFTGSQVAGTLPAEFDADVDNFVIFLSSDDEFFYLGDTWADPLFGNQYNALKFIIENYAPLGKIWVRAHPNMAGMDAGIVAKYRALVCNQSNYTFIEPDDKVSTYALIDNCSKVVSFGSTVGIEAAYWGKPSISVGMSFYRNLGGVYVPDSAEGLLSLLTNPIDSLQSDGPSMYGHFMATYGHVIEGYEPIDQLNGTYNGHPIYGYVSSNAEARIISAINKRSIQSNIFNQLVHNTLDRLITLKKSVNL